MVSKLVLGVIARDVLADVKSVAKPFKVIKKVLPKPVKPVRVRVSGRYGAKKRRKVFKKQNLGFTRKR